jgi:hypothetical protein
MLVDRHFLREKVVLDEDDGDAAVAPGVDDAPDGREQALGVERIRQLGLLLKKPLSRSTTMTALRRLIRDLRDR